MADRRDQQLGQRGNPTDGVGAPGSTGAFKTSDPLGAPGSTGAGLTHHDPTSIPGVGAAFEDTEFDHGGGQQQLRNPTSGFGETDQQQGDHHLNPNPTEAGHVGSGLQQKLHDPISGVGFGDGGQQQGHHLNPTDPTSGVGLGSTPKGQQQGHHAGTGLHDPTPDVGFVGGTGHQQEHQHHHLNPTAGAGYGGTGNGQHLEIRDRIPGVGSGDRSQQHERRDPTSGITGSNDKSEFNRGQVGQGAGGVSETAAPARAEQEGKEEKKGMAEKAREMKDKIKGAACGGHSP